MGQRGLVLRCYEFLRLVVFADLFLFPMGKSPVGKYVQDP